MGEDESVKDHWLDPTIEPPVEVVYCGGWCEFSDALHSGDGQPRSPLYRGQANPSLALVAPSRRRFYDLWKAQGQAGREMDLSQAGLLDGQWKHFLKLSIGLPGPDITKLDHLEAQALARHHGLVSNLLDWSESPYVAAFFAFRDVVDRYDRAKHPYGTPLYFDGEVAIWRLSWGSDLHRPGELELVTAQSSINYWQKAQSGHFTRLQKRPYLDLARYLDSIGELKRLRKIVVPAREAHRVLSDLAEMNITYARLMPDFRGAAVQANLIEDEMFLGMIARRDLGELMATGRGSL